MEMHCNQCQETARNRGCTVRGVCGKDPQTAALQDLLAYAVKGISMWAHRAGGLGARDRQVDVFVVQALFSTVTNVNFDPQRLRDLLLRAAAVRGKASKDGRVYCFSCSPPDPQNVVPLWSYVLPGDEPDCEASPVIDPLGMLYIGCDDGSVVAIRTYSAGLADSPWPMLGRGPRHTARKPPRQLALAVHGGSGSGSYDIGRVVHIHADVPFRSSFEQWTRDTFGIEDLRAESTTIRMIADAEVSATFVPWLDGDANNDKCVNVADLMLVRNNLGSAGPNITPPEVDVYGEGGQPDGTVNVADLMFVRNRLGLGDGCPR